MPEYIVWRRFVSQEPVTVDAESPEQAKMIVMHDGGEADDSNVEFIEYMDSTTWNVEEAEDTETLVVPLHQFDQQPWEPLQSNPPEPWEPEGMNF
jgi:hypothetical protein